MHSDALRQEIPAKFGKGTASGVALVPLAYLTAAPAAALPALDAPALLDPAPVSIIATAVAVTVVPLIIQRSPRTGTTPPSAGARPPAEITACGHNSRQSDA